ncbi:MAG: anaerobic ribonucleoside-triphosphate reductase activating protein [Eubacteriales bacterium]|nr:anaerobic ribonucleoside-triphosphate reductase activating protein [Eubacteriales bacterium]MDD4422823.1 anaerobic ribonucleoside-triphosphate reductase activating protein [Eubacteriales bacterium]
MNIQGLQKLTLLDYPGVVACTVFTGGCNFRCPFCHNASLVLTPDSESGITYEDFFTFLKKRKGALDGVCITGGEPLMQSDIHNFITEIKALGYKVKLDTNGSFPERLIKLIDSGMLDYVAMDIKNSPKYYAKTAGKEIIDIDAVKESAKKLMTGSLPFEFRTTLVRTFHTEDSIRSIGLWLKGEEKYFLQNFVDSGNLIESGLCGFSEKESRYLLDILRIYVPNAALRGF